MTKRGEKMYKRLKNFNSHPHEEDDELTIKPRIPRKYFNSHPHEEDDRKQLWHRWIEMYFNSHPHEEDDVVFLIGRHTNEGISTHILTKRMTTEVFLERSDSLHFNSHPHEEDDSNFKQK